MAKEIFVIYNRITGFIDGGAGRIDREWDQANLDGSTMSERIVEILARDLDREVVYLPNQNVPSHDRHKIIDSEIVDLTARDLDDIEAARPASELELIKTRVDALERIEPAQI